MVIEADPVADGTRGVLDAVEALAMNTLLFQGPDHTLNHAVLLRAVGRDELLLQTVAFHQGCVFSTRKDQAIVRPQKELPRDPAKRAKSGNQSVLQGAGSRRGLARSGEMPAQKLAGMAVDHQCKRCPAISPCPNAAQIRRPALVRGRGDGRQRLDPRAHTDRSFANLPALDLEDPLNRVFIEAQEPSHRAIAKGWFCLDHHLDRVGKPGIDLRRGLGWLVVDRPARHTEPGAQLGQRH